MPGPTFTLTEEITDDATRRTACRRCGGPAEWIDCPTGGWWAHDVHPADGHDAEAES